MFESWENTSKSRIIWESLGEYGRASEIFTESKIYTEYRGFLECSGKFHKFSVNFGEFRRVSENIRWFRSARESLQEFARVWGSLG